MDVSSKYNTRQRFVIVAGTRTGGTFLTSCLDSHPLIACWRSEPLHSQSTFMVSFGDIGIGVAWKAAYIIWERDGYQATGFKVTYEQYDTLWACRGPAELDAVKVIHPMRMVVDSVLSREIAHRRASDPTYHHHTCEQVPLSPISLHPADFAKACLKALETRTVMRARLKNDFGARVLDIWYDQFTDNSGHMPEAAASTIERYLGVDTQPLYSPTRSVNHHYGRSALVNNWGAVSRVLKQCKIPEVLDEELAYVARAV